MGCELRIEISIFRIGEAFRCASRLVFAITKRHSNRWNDVLQGIHCINLESGHLRGPNSRSGSKKSNYINLGSGDLRGLRDAVKYDLGDCINLGFGHLRGLDKRTRLDHENCINLESGYLRGHAKSRARDSSHCICWSVPTATKVRITDWVSR